MPHKRFETAHRCALPHKAIDPALSKLWVMAQSCQAYSNARQRQRFKGSKNGVANTSILPEESISQAPLPKSPAREHKSELRNGVPSSPLSRSSQLNSVTSDSITSKYSSVTFGRARGIRKPRLSSSQAANDSLTLPQLNKDLAEALAALKARSDVSAKSTGSIAKPHMSGPVTLESLPVSSTVQDGSASASSRIVSFNGQTIEVPDKIFCHLCDSPMRLGLRKIKHKEGIRLYVVYRCVRRGCQTYRSVRSVIEADDSYGGGGGSQNTDVPTGYPFAFLSFFNFVFKELWVLRYGFLHKTLIYVKKEVTVKQMEKMLDFDFKFFNNKPAPKHLIPRLLFGRLNMSISEMDELLETAQGQKEIQHLMMRFHQPSPPPCIIEAAERWEAMARDDQPQFIRRPDYRTPHIDSCNQ
ncbi:unnamed protein product [Cylicocyclus nassatus]|uniref:Uncharacterized protein n=1 Tax=Cylicocyclus nassatus TaxID=53992 RepID=A0AA36GRI7_CYLNA|nr:unnamed protein product [Cylicocyclus nassatus]